MIQAKKLQRPCALQKAIDPLVIRYHQNDFLAEASCLQSRPQTLTCASRQKCCFPRLRRLLCPQVTALPEKISPKYGLTEALLQYPLSWHT